MSASARISNDLIVQVHIRIRIRKIKHVINPSRVHTYDTYLRSKDAQIIRLPYYHHKLGSGA